MVVVRHILYVRDYWSRQHLTFLRRRLNVLQPSLRELTQIFLMTRGEIWGRGEI